MIPLKVRCPLPTYRIGAVLGNKKESLCSAGQTFHLSLHNYPIHYPVDSTSSAKTNTRLDQMFWKQN